MGGEIYAEVDELRRDMRAGDPLPDWNPIQWVNTLTVKVGQAAHGAALLDGAEDIAYAGLNEAGKQHWYRETMKAIAECALDAIENFDADHPT